MKLKDVQLKENEVLEIGYFNFKGRECIMNNQYQVLKGCIIDSIKESCPEMEVVKTDKGYASKFIANKKGY